MIPKKIGFYNGLFFFFFWLLVLLAGADKPPPLGFLWLILVVFLGAVVVYWRIPIYIKWYRTKMNGRKWRVVLDGFLAGLVVAVPFVLMGSGEPSITMNTVNTLVWFLLLGFVGLFTATALYLINSLVANRIDAAAKRSQSSNK